jgi:hypothetical protein
MSDITLNLTLNQALNIHSACMMAVQHYAKIVAEYAPDGGMHDFSNGEMHEYFKKRLLESEGAERLLKQAMHNPKWETQLDLIHDLSHNHWHE